jgi:hypothetical protein
MALRGSVRRPDATLIPVSECLVFNSANNAKKPGIDEANSGPNGRSERPQEPCGGPALADRSFDAKR